MDRKAFTTEVNRAIQEYCRDKQRESATVAKEYVQLWEHIEQYLMAGGKRVRPYLVYLAYTAYGGVDGKGIVQVAAAWELLHACLLIHDDIIDRDTIRHGQLNIAGTYEQLYKKTADGRAAHYALSAALLAGDLLLSATYELIGTADLSDSQKLVAEQHIARAMFAVGGGEFIDFESALHPIQSVDTDAISHHKTATYSFQIPMQCGASLADAPKEQCDVLDKLGLHIGIAFQLRDDLLGVFGDEETTGKSNRSDIFEKKRTMLVQAAQKALEQDQADRLEELYQPSHELTEDEAEEVTELIDSSGARSIVEKEITNRVEQADALVNQLDVPEDSRVLFLGLIDKVAVRSR